MRGPSDIERFGVVGAGTMGADIAQVAAVEGYEVVLRDLEREYLGAGLERIEDGLDRRAEGGDLTGAEAAAARERVTGTLELADLGNADVVVEAVVEDLAVKREAFADLDDLLAPDVVLATNTSTLSITSIAAATGTPSRVVGLHFMNPVPVMEGVEVVVGERTSDGAREVAHGVAESLGKTAWESDDRPGFVVNRVLMPWINEGIRAYDEGVATREDLDRGMRLGTNVPMGPLELADHVGLDVVLHSTETLHEQLGDRYAPAYLLRRKVEAGHLGKKTGQGFYEYDDG